MNNYYVYVYWRLDTNEPFYVGKGKEERWKDLRRKYNNHFINIINKYPTIVVIEKDNLTEEEAFYWEEEIIRQLVFEYGFSIDIRGCNSNDHYCHLVNKTWGGEGVSGYNPLENKTKEEIKEWKEKISEANRGRNHPNYGKNHSYETRNKIRTSLIGKHHTKESKEKMSVARKGEKNPNYGKHHSYETKNKISNANKGKYIGKNNPSARSVICLTTKRIFLTVKDASEYYKCNRVSISFCCKKKYKTAGKLLNGTPLIWRYINWEHDKKYRVKNRKLSNNK